jgi:hypothetical protein
MLLGSVRDDQKGQVLISRLTGMWLFRGWQGVLLAATALDVPSLTNKGNYILNSLALPKS